MLPEVGAVQPLVIPQTPEGSSLQLEATTIIATTAIAAMAMAIAKTVMAALKTGMRIQASATTKTSRVA